MRNRPVILVVLPLAYQNGRDSYTGILRYLAGRQRDWNIRLVRQGLPRQILSQETNREIAGVIFDCSADAALPSVIARSARPCVLLHAPRPDKLRDRHNTAFVDIDSDAVGRRGAEYLRKQGNYAAFGVLGYEQDCIWSERRVESYQRNLAQQEIPCATLRVRRNALHASSTSKALLAWAAHLHRPAAVMAVCDELARRFVDCLTSAGVNIPRDVAVLGVDNEWILCTHIQPTLSSIQPDFEYAGYVAASCLDRMLKRPASSPLHETCPVQKIIGRQSTAPSSATGRMILKAEEYIRENVGRRLNVDAVASHLKVSRRLLDLRFRETTGRTVLAAIHAEELNRVRHLLRNTTLSITEIGTRENFRSENHLKRLFKATYGMTMTDYRRKQGRLGG